MRGYYELLDEIREKLGEQFADDLEAAVDNLIYELGMPRNLR